MFSSIEGLSYMNSNIVLLLYYHCIYTLYFPIQFIFYQIHEWEEREREKEREAVLNLFVYKVT